MASTVYIAELAQAGLTSFTIARLKATYHREKVSIREICLIDFKDAQRAISLLPVKEALHFMLPSLQRAQKNISSVKMKRWLSELISPISSEKALQIMQESWEYRRELLREKANVSMVTVIWKLAYAIVYNSAFSVSSAFFDLSFCNVFDIPQQFKDLQAE